MKTTQQRGRTNAKDELAEAAKRHIEVRYAEAFSLEAIASELFVNRHYLDRVFKQATGETLLHYHNRVRCEAAKALLSKPEHSIAFIGRDVGYISASHFARVFKGMCGCTPSAYRRRCKNHPEEGAEIAVGRSPFAGTDDNHAGIPADRI